MHFNAIPSDPRRYCRVALTRTILEKTSKTNWAGVDFPPMGSYRKRTAWGKIQNLTNFVIVMSLWRYADCCHFQTRDCIDRKRSAFSARTLAVSRRTLPRKAEPSRIIKHSDTTYYCASLWGRKLSTGPIYSPRTARSRRRRWTDRTFDSREKCSTH